MHFSIKRMYLVLATVFISAALNAQKTISVKTTREYAAGLPAKIQVEANVDTASFYSINTGGEKLVAQPQTPHHLVFIPQTNITAGTTLKFTRTNAQEKPHVRFIVDENGIACDAEEKKVFYYHTAVVNPPADSPAYYRRSGFIHPLYSPSGKILTDDFPAGHAHQHAIFITWVNTTFKKEFLDFWNQHHQKGTVEHLNVEQVKPGPVFGTLKVNLQHKSHSQGPILSDHWTVYVYAVKKGFLVDFESVQQNITSDTLYINKYHYGGMAFRGSKYWNRDDKKNFQSDWRVLTSEQKTMADANHTHARWVSITGELESSTAGAVVFDHPHNFRYPNAIRVHPSMPYWCYAPMVDSAFVFAPGVPYVSRYRYYIYEGEPELEYFRLIEQQWIKD